MPVSLAHIRGLLLPGLYKVNNMPVSLSSYNSLMMPFIAELRNRLPGNIIDIDLGRDHLFDCLTLMVCVEQEGIYKHRIGREHLDNWSPDKVGHLITSFINSHAPSPILSTAAGAEEYDMAMEAQDAMDKLSPQS